MTSVGLLGLARLRFSEVCEDRKPFDRISWCNGYIQGWMDSKALDLSPKAPKAVDHE